MKIALLSVAIGCGDLEDSNLKVLTIKGSTGLMDEIYELNKEASLNLANGYQAMINFEADLYNRNPSPREALYYHTTLLRLQMEAGDMTQGKISIKKIEELWVDVDATNLWNQYLKSSSIGMYHIRNEQYDSALKSYDELIIVGEMLNDTSILSEAYTGKGWIYSDLSIHQLAVDYFYKALTISELTNDSVNILNDVNNLANAYSAMGDLEATRKYTKKQEYYANQFGYNEEMGFVYGNTGIAFYDANQIDSANFYFNKALKSFLSSGYRIESSGAYAYSAATAALMGNISLAEKYVAECDKIIEEYELQESKFRNLVAKFEIDYAKGDFKKAENHLNQAKKLLTENGMGSNSELLGLFVRLFETIGDDKKSLKAFKTKEALEDSIFNLQSNYQIAELQTKYETAKKEEKLNQQHLDLISQKSRTNRIFFALIAVSLTFILLLIIYYLARKSKRQLSIQNITIEKQKVELESLNYTKDRLFAVISHDLKNIVTSFQGVGQLITKYVKTNKLDRIPVIAKELDNEAQKLNELLDNLLSWSIRQMGDKPFSPEHVDLKKSVEEIMELYEKIALAKEVTLENDFHHFSNVVADKQALGIILRNCVGNAIKFSHPGSSVKILTEEKEGKIDISIKDFGTGLSKDQLDSILNKGNLKSTDGTLGEKGSGLGVAVSREYIELHDSELQIQSEYGKGTIIKFELKIAA